MYKSALILAAGKGTRMKSDLPKVLHKVCGKEMVNHVIDTLREAGIDDVNVIIGTGAQKVEEATESKNVSYTIQNEQLGTGHAVICAKEFLENKKGTVAIFTGDAPLITKESVIALIDFHENNNNKATLLTSILTDANGYGRVIRNSENDVEKIVEHKDCDENELKVKEINAGMYAFDIEMLLLALAKLSNNNSQGEYYLTDVIEILKKDNHRVGAMAVPFEETLGVNSRIQLGQVEEIMRNRINEAHMINGVTLIDSKNTYIGADVVIGNDTIIYPGCVIEGKTTIGRDVVIKGTSRLENVQVGDRTTIDNSVIVKSKVGEDTSVGPFAYIRPESTIGNEVKIGDFVEIKKAKIGDKTKVSHLTYIGDAEVGESCNFGCGTVVVNYDGKKKHLTKIGNNAFIGCNTNLVSPVTVEDDAYIAAGSTITKTVESGALAIARAKQINIKGWVNKKRIK
ncbi:bifunctional UDP-N-acetylglucosamine diphosphorylase/glucosamine-1-phosphate N-acetyltransferase GlmU [Clostridium cellulovorans]|uniref:Bifunctional protein GlmU n=1 Tax=Clostridium cellulovorans (strain ATCC 35296 / DSM 3052 / OCM 3 / 743B) TaxID=573061 RepID=D9SKQ6_CLOC7|nr:bifunctional UDP-N-acetylglucosamine diphosphorylase/glucosamine-1-phosphate N-acetyltransferase GlmU [Clostridium cellulovorans]ADL53478.1 UDP-N-acetylglucosamine pyrophosphorylase [Clostridium cellulovorans 743B]